MKYLLINGHDISKYIKALTPTHEPIWSTNAGRTMTATFVGDIVARKWKLEVTTRALSQEECAYITTLLEKSPFLAVSFIPTNSSEDNTMTTTMYVGTPTQNVYSYATGLPRYDGMSFSLIER